MDSCGGYMEANEDNRIKQSKKLVQGYKDREASQYIFLFYLVL